MNDGRPRGKWHPSGLWRFCDCGSSQVMLLNQDTGAPGVAQSPKTFYCPRCQIYRPLKKDIKTTDTVEVKWEWS
jgi:hypothetical protein